MTIKAAKALLQANNYLVLKRPPGYADDPDNWILDTHLLWWSRKDQDFYDPTDDPDPTPRPAAAGRAVSAPPGGGGHW
jgi:hypothetical protein